MPILRRVRAAATALVLVLGALLAEGSQGASNAELAPSTPHQDFVAPAAGSYRLPPIQRAPNGRVVDIDGRTYALARYTRDRVTLLSFMYTYCVDPVGCPLAYATLTQLRERLLRRPDLARQVRLVSLSFDPSHDDAA